MGRPKLKASKQLNSRNIRTTDSWWSKLKRFVKVRGYTTSEYIREAVDEKMERDK